MTNMMQVVKMDAYRKLRRLTPEQEQELVRRLVRYRYSMKQLEDAVKYEGLLMMEEELYELDCSDVVYEVMFCLGEWIVDGCWGEEYEIEATDLYWMRKLSPVDAFLVYYVIHGMVNLLEWLQQEDKLISSVAHYNFFLERKFSERIRGYFIGEIEKESVRYSDEFVRKYLPQVFCYNTNFVVNDAVELLEMLQEALDSMNEEEYKRLCVVMNIKDYSIIKGLGRAYFYRLFELNNSHLKYLVTEYLCDTKDDPVEDGDILTFWNKVSEVIKDESEEN